MEGKCWPEDTVKLTGLEILAAGVLIKEAIQCIAAPAAIAMHKQTMAKKRIIFFIIFNIKIKRVCR